MGGEKTATAEIALNEVININYDKENINYNNRNYTYCRRSIQKTI